MAAQPSIKLEFYLDENNAIFVHYWDAVTSEWAHDIKWAEFIKSGNTLNILDDIYKHLISGYKFHIMQWVNSYTSTNNATSDFIQYVIKNFISVYLSRNSFARKNIECVSDDDVDIIIYSDKSIIIKVETDACFTSCPKLLDIKDYVSLQMVQLFKDRKR